MSPVSSLCVFCGSSLPADRSIIEAADRLGRLTAGAGRRLVYGGGGIGLMGTVARAAVAAGGAVTGVIPAFLLAFEVGLTEGATLEVVDSMHARKTRMFELSDAFVALPGGLGTLDEVIEIITWRQLGLHDKPIVLIDHAGYWQPLLDLVDHVIAKGFAKADSRHLFSVVSSVDEVHPALDQAPERRIGARPERL
jgi:uncharacterized protein (TIGR00730 family)